MTTQEFSSEFDILYNNIMSNQAPGLDEYEKSVFLTKAQDEIVKNYFNSKGNKYQEGFDKSEKRQIDFSTLIKVAKPSVYSNNSYLKFDDRSQLFQMPNDILFVLNETALNIVNGISKLITIIPLNFDEYSRIISKPYKQPLKNQGWRLIQSPSNTGFITEIIVKEGSSIEDYKVRYVRRPKPIILTDLSDAYTGVSINGLTNVTECELDPILHPEILQRAVELARVAYTGDMKSTVELGQRSE